MSSIVVDIELKVNISGTSLPILIHTNILLSYILFFPDVL